MGREVIYQGESVVEEAIDWTYLEEGEAVAPGAAVIVPLERWLAEGEALGEVAAHVGVLLHGGDDPAQLVGRFEQLATIAIRFPKFADGRGYSIARLLRDRYGWRGELRATGQILQDQLFYLKRCGFDVLELMPHKSAEAALQAFREFSVVYQPASDYRAPVYAAKRPWPEEMG